MPRAVTPASAAHVTNLIAVPAWAMFMGWVAYYTRGHSGRRSRQLCLRRAWHLSRVHRGDGGGALAPSFGTIALPLVVLVIATLFVSLRAFPVLNNIPAYFLGLVTVFAVHVQPTLYAVAQLGSAGAIGSFAAWFASRSQHRLATR